MTVVILAEKPSVARDIAGVVGASTPHEGYLTGRDFAVTWALGHLVTLAQPHEIEAAWKVWNMALLPMLPREFPLVVAEETRRQFDVIKKLLNSRATTEVICATDAGREGELIFRYIYEASNCRKPVRRLWISSLTQEAIADGLRHLRKGADYDRLASAAKGRARADWLVGMNLSRAYSLAFAEEISVGRVQTPTLTLLAEREHSIRNFVPEKYLEVVATFGIVVAQGTESAAEYSGTWRESRPPTGPKPSDALTRGRLPIVGDLAREILHRVRGGDARIETVTSETRRIPPPLLYDLTELQRHANRLYGLSAKATLDVAQSLYERHKLISYPRTDSRHLTTDLVPKLPKIVESVSGPFIDKLSAETGQRPLGRRFVDDTKVTDHHAILPTAVNANRAKLTKVEAQIYDLVVRRLLSAWHADYEFATTTLVTQVTSGRNTPVTDRFESRGTMVLKLGWKVLDVVGAANTKAEVNRSKNPLTKASAEKSTDAREAGPDGEKDGPPLPANLRENQPVKVLCASSRPKQTVPPKRFTEATLLTAMETAGQKVEEKELSDAMRERGLGTPATRAQIIETLLRRQYLERHGKALNVTDKGLFLVDVVHPDVRSPALTGDWEARLKRLERGECDLAEFMQRIEGFVEQIVSEIQGRPTHPAVRLADVPKVTTAQTIANRPSKTTEPEPVRTKHVPLTQPACNQPRPTTVKATELKQLLTSRFGHQAFRPHQQAVCEKAAEGRDLLLVMPTGAGKSLCYQLPGVARGGTTLVISPLIALMNDQSAKLQALGFAAESLHSGRPREDSRKVCRAYLDGTLDFLFVAPERLGVSGFPELLAKRELALIAIDEAHCISQWGHDFRPDYRLLGERLPKLRPAPVLALTATATPRVQEDIMRQLGLVEPERFIQGFRRDNIAIRHCELSPRARPHAIKEYLSESGRCPAIVYTTTRKSAEAIGELLAQGLEHLGTGIYHAGLDARVRERIQTEFLSGKLDIIVATVAFGMGIDKSNVRTVVHAAMPGSVEGYYQEIGRAGRDGLPSTALLLHGYVDRKTHDFFFERDYPDPAQLSRIFDKLTLVPQDGAKLRQKTRLRKAEFEPSLEKLVLHRGAQSVAADQFVRGRMNWLEHYESQRTHVRDQVERMSAYAQSTDCRMMHLVRHFGDHSDHGTACGICDVCNPSSKLELAREPEREARSARTRPTKNIAKAILGCLARTGGCAVGRLFTDASGGKPTQRPHFYATLRELEQTGLIVILPCSFTKEGKAVSYERVELTAVGRVAGGAAVDASPITKVRVQRRKARAPMDTSNDRADSTKKVPRKASAKATAKKTWNKWFFINRAKRKKPRKPSN